MRLAVRPHPSSSEEWDSGCIRRVDAAATVLDEIMRTPDKGIPEELLDSAKCVAVIPSMVKIGFIFGGRHGRELATCRTSSGWSAPATFSLTGGSWGLQIGGEAVDVVMLIMNDHGMERRNECFPASLRLEPTLRPPPAPRGATFKARLTGRCV